MDYSQHVRLLPRVRTCSFVMLMVTMAATLLTAAEASASRYHWKHDLGGDWTVATNWINVDDDPDGYPNGADDDAIIDTSGTASRQIVIPENSTITIRTLSVSTSQSYSIHARGSGPGRGKLVFNSGSAANAMVTLLNANGELKIAAPVRLESPLSVYVGVSGRVGFREISQQAFYALSVTKAGQGTLEFQDRNSYKGTTHVRDGVLELTSSTMEPPTIDGPLDVGDGIGAAHSATVLVMAGHQISSAFVNVKADGWLEFRRSDAIGHLSVNDGTVVLKKDCKLSLGGLDMIGGTVTADVGSEYTLDGDVTAVSSPNGPAMVTGSSTGTLHLPASRSFHVNDGVGTELEIGITVTGGPSAALIKDGPGFLAFTGTFANTYEGPTQVREGALLLVRTSAVAVPGPLQIGFDDRAAAVSLNRSDNIADTATVTVATRGTFVVFSAQDTIAALSLLDGDVNVAGTPAARLIVTGRLEMVGGDVVLSTGRVDVNHIAAASVADGPARIRGDGVVAVRGEGIRLDVADGPPPIDLVIDASITSLTTQGIVKTGPGSVRLSGNNQGHHGPTNIAAGTLIVTGPQPASLVRLIGGTLIGTGTVGSVIADAATLAPGLSVGPLATDSLTFAAETTVAIELNDAGGRSADKLLATGTVTLGYAVLAVSAGVAPPSGASFTIIDNDGADPINGTFAGLAEGSTLTVLGVTLTISYHGGDGNDVVLSHGNPHTYSLAEGATGAFFDNDILIANPNTTDAPVTLTFLKEGGSTVVERRMVPAQGRLTVHVEEIPGLEDASASTQVASDDRLPLIVERTMFWDASYYGGHTANALAQPRKRWIFAEGSQGFFDTYILIANANAEPATATLTFLRENATPFVTTVPVAAFARKTVYAGDYPELAGRAFGVIVEADQPTIAERAMYFAKQPGRIWVGGHVNTGIVEPSMSWFHAEGATGSFFTTFILLSNPQDTEAKVELRFLLDNGTVVTKHKTIAAQQRLTINPAVEDARLENAALSTVVQSDVPIVSERSMYWQEGVTPFGEGHNSTGVVSTATRWGLAEGRVGGPREFVTYILLANPSATAADVTVTYVREGGAPIVQTYNVPPTSRFNIDVKNVVPELEGTSFGAVIAVKNGVPIAVERSLYWNANGALWAGGTNALGTPIPEP